MPASEPRDRWSKFEVIAGAYWGMLLPIIILAVGHLYTVNTAKQDRAFGRSIAKAADWLTKEPDSAALTKKFAQLSARFVEYDLRLLSQPAGARAYIAPAEEGSDESKYRLVGTTPLETREFAGAYALRFELDGQTIRERVTVSNGAKNEVKVTFK